VALLDGKPLADGLTTWAQSDHGKHFVSAPANSGGGAQGGGGSSGKRTITRADFSSMSPADQASAGAAAAKGEIVIAD
jgi:hypothetical protein